MPWTCVLHEQRPENPKPGDMWPDPEMIEGELAEYYRQNLLSEKYFRRWHSRRPPLVVRLPNGVEFCVDSRPTKGGTGWDVTGEAPSITVSPSINSNGFSREHGYHGWLQNGVLSDDVEGRKF